MSDVQIDPRMFLASFLEEAQEHLATIERTALELEQSPEDVDLLNAMFRAAHSIKGGSATFGLPAIAAYTHSLEELLDRLRSRTLTLTPPILNVLLRGRDIIEEYLTNARAGSDAIPQGSQASLDEIAVIIGRPATASQHGASKPQAVAAPADGPADAKRRVDIRFVPGGDIFQQGADPLLLLRNVAALGDARVELDASKLPALADLDPETSYLGWSIALDTESTNEEVRDVFSFVEDSSLLTITDAPKAKAAPQEAVPAAAEKAHAPGKPAHGSSAASAAEATIRVATDKVERLINLAGELVIAHATIREALSDVSPNGMMRLREAVEGLERNTRELQDRVLSVRMVPVSTVFGRFPRLVRDAAATLGKNVHLEMEGEDTEMDRGLAEKLADPLTHLVRNAVDHGLEAPEERSAADKSPTGTVHLRAYHRGGSVVVEVEDDGRGLDPQKLRAKAIKLGILQEEEVLSDSELHQLIFRAGFSTAAKVTDLSGRGVGMDVVKRNVDALHGTLTLTSELGHGCRIRLALPLTLAVIDGLAVRVGSQDFILPLLSVVESFRPVASQMRTVFGRGELIEVRGESLPLVRLHRLPGVDGGEEDPCRAIVCVVEAGEEHLAVLVDELVGQSQIVIKALEANYRKVEGFMGATILGNGRVALILDPMGLGAVAANKGRRADAKRERHEQTPTFTNGGAG